LTNEDGSQTTVEHSVANPFTIMLEIARGCYLEDVLFGKAGSLERSQVSSFIEIAGRLPAKELAEYVNEHMAERMFLVSTNITAADIVVFAALASYFAKELKDFEKIALAHAFRWIDHI